LGRLLLLQLAELLTLLGRVGDLLLQLTELGPDDVQLLLKRGEAVGGLLPAVGEALRVGIGRPLGGDLDSLQPKLCIGEFAFEPLAALFEHLVHLHRLAGLRQLALQHLHTLL
jgi:hypothetical protein